MDRNRERGDQDPIEERLLDDGETAEDSIVTAADEAFRRSQEDPTHPSRIERQHGVEDPSHSRGSRRRES